jgi:SSS family solute:Na+ symporter
MLLGTIDWLIIASFLGLSLLIGIVVSKRAGSSSSEFFLSGRSMPWWLLGFSMVATTFSTDTPNFVTNLVRENGVAGNWVWWAFLLTGMLTVFVYAKLWRRTGLMTDIQFYELRYGGRPAAFLRGFRASYMAFVFGVIMQATVSLAAIKIFGLTIGLKAWQVLVIMGGITAIYSMIGGLSGVIWTDFFQFAVAMIGSVAAAVVALRHPAVGGLHGLLTHSAVLAKTSLLPDFSNTDLTLTIFIIPLTVQWWSVWYPGSEPGGGAYVVQRMLSARNERHAVAATLFFNVAHYALRPWPWIIVALCSLVVFPDLESLRKAFPQMAPNLVRNDLGYSAMLTFLPAGLMGLVVASLIAAYMSTISTQLNLMSSYAVNDLYRRFYKPQASEKELVRAGRIATVLLLCCSSLLALQMESAKKSFDLILSIGAGTGLAFILRWFWWRISAYTEIAALVVSFLVSMYWLQIHGRLGFAPFKTWQQLLISVAVTTAAWLLVTFLTPPTEERKLREFYRRVQPGGPGWRSVVERAQADGEDLTTGARGWDVPLGILCMIFGCFAIYGALFATGQFIYGHLAWGIGLTLEAAVSALVVMKLWTRMSMDKSGTSPAEEPAAVGQS